MTAQIRLKAVAALALVGAAALGGCGDSSEPSAASTPETRHAAAERIVAQATSVNEKARSGRIDGIVKLRVAGVARFEGPIELTASGVFNLPEGASVPDVDIDVGVSLDGAALGGAIVVADGEGYIKLGNVGYKLPDEISRKLVAPARAARNGLTKTGAMFYVNPHDWRKNAELVGDSTTAGEATEHITSEIDTEAAFLDLSRLVRFLTLIRVTHALDLPTALGPKIRAALVRSVTASRGEVWMGKSDHVLRKGRLVGRGVVAPRDRRTLFGARSASLDATLTISELGVPQEIRAPQQLASYASLQLTLSALAEAARNKAGRSGR